MVKKLVVLMTVLLATVPVCAQTSFTGSGDFSGAAVLWFSGTDVTAEFSGRITISGSVTIDGHPFRFTARGSTHGVGDGDTSTMEGVAWGVFTLVGRTDTGERIEISGGITGNAGSFTFSSDMTAGSGTAEFFALIAVGEEKIEATGLVQGEASGGFVPPDEDYTMQAEGKGTMTFRTNSAVPAGDPATIAARLPWKLTAWPAGVRTELLSLLGAAQRDESSTE